MRCSVWLPKLVLYFEVGSATCAGSWASLVGSRVHVSKHTLSKQCQPTAWPAWRRDLSVLSSIA